MSKICVNAILNKRKKENQTRYSTKSDLSNIMVKAKHVKNNNCIEQCNRAQTDLMNEKVNLKFKCLLT